MAGIDNDKIAVQEAKPAESTTSVPCTTSALTWQVTAVAECAVQLSGFKNVDLFSQGVYQVRVRAYADRSGRAAVPFAITELPLPPLPGSVNSEQLLPAHRRLRAPLGSATG